MGELDDSEDDLDQTLNDVINFINDSSPRFQKLEDAIASINMRFEEIRGEFDVKIGKMHSEFEEKHQTLMTRLDETNKKIDEFMQLESEHKKELEDKIAEEIAAQNMARDELNGVLEATRTKQREELEEKISETNRNLQALAKNLGATKLDINEKHESVTTSITETNTRIEEVQTDLNTKNETIHSTIKQLEQSRKEEVDNYIEELRQTDKGLDERITQNTQRLDANDQQWENRNTEFQNRKNEIDNINNELMQFAGALRESIVETNKILAANKKEQDTNLIQVQENLQGQITTLHDRTEVLNNGVQTLRDVTSQYGEVIDSQSQSYHALHDELKTFSTQVKEDQSELLQSTQRIVQGIAGDLRTEIILANKTAREMLEDYRREIQGTYYSITDGQRVQEEIKGLEKEYVAKAERIRDDLTNSLRRNIESMEARTQKSIETVKTYKAELDDYKDDITVFIERRVAEKMDWIHDILSRTAKKTEELKHQIRHVQIAPAQRTSVVVSSLEKVEYPHQSEQEATTDSEVEEELEPEDEEKAPVDSEET